MKTLQVGIFVFCAALLIGLFSSGDAQLLGQFLGFPRQQQQQQPQQQQFFRPLQQLFQPQRQQQQQQLAPQTSVSTADSEAYNRDLKFGNLGLNGGVSQSNTQTSDGHGGFSAERTTSTKNGVQLGDLGISNTLTGSRGINNGQISGEVMNNFQVGNFGLESSLSRENLNHGFGVHQSENGGVELDLGFLNIDLTRNENGVNANGATGTSAQVQAEGENANADSKSDTDSHTDEFGGLTSTATHSKSKARGSALNGLTSGNAAGLISGSPSSAKSGGFGLFPRRRFARQGGFYFPDDDMLTGFNEGGPQANTGASAGSFGSPQQFVNNADAFADGDDPGFSKQAAANTNSQTINNENGQFQDNSGSSISSNLANDGSAGQLSAANTAQQSYQNADGSFGDKNAAQSQSTNFDKDHKQATSTNSDTSFFQDGNTQKSQGTSGASAMEQGLFGASANTANTNTNSFTDESGRQGSDSNSNSQSTLTGANGQVDSAQTGSKTSSVINADGSTSNKAESQAASFSNHGGPVSASSSSSSGSGPGGSFSNAQGLSNANGANSNGFTQTGFQGFPGFQQGFQQGFQGFQGNQGHQGGRRGQHQQFMPFSRGQANAFG